MLKTIKLKNFRGFKSFKLQQLGRVNLLVGTNNSGKTSVLEAIQLLCGRNNLDSLIEIMKNRGEYFVGDDGKGEPELDIRHLFYGHEIELGSQFSISGTNKKTLEESIEGTIGLRSIGSKYDSSRSFEEETISLTEKSFDSDLNDLKGLNISIKWVPGEEEDKRDLLLSPNGGLSFNSARRWRLISKQKKIATRTQFVTSSSLTTEKMIELFDQVVLTPEEKLVQEALQVIEPRIERIASVSSNQYRRSDSRGAFVVRLSDSDQRVPIGSMGDGLWRILGLALATVSAEGGVLFVDEIDTGLHFSTMSDMWKLICETSKRLNVQVFATTHSSDCWTSLANIASQEDVAEDGITIQRIERGKEEGIVFNEREIVIAAEQGIEVR
ncbi:MAG: AAA family ATPase [Microcoleus vaginatus WJT46-NPBG5]|jgi:AAA15 family ATPase/GTPase|nr:AAA family ATPase [Microcoleus vaginatus WJT46-NPBG5]